MRTRAHPSAGRRKAVPKNARSKTILKNAKNKTVQKNGRSKPDLKTAKTTSEQKNGRRKLLRTARKASVVEDSAENSMEDQNNNKVKKAALKNVGASRVVARIKKRKHSPMKTRGLEKKALKETKSPCRVCRMSAGEDIELLKCAKCPVEVHKTKKCIGLTQLDYVVPGKWICPKCTVCHQCGKFIEDAGNRVCYRCGHAFHGACAPKISSRLDDWLCDMCFPFVAETDDASATSTTSSKTPTRGGRQRKSLNGARQRLPWCPGLQEQRDKIHNNIVDHYKMHHNISFSSDELDPDEPSTSYQDGDFPIATDVDWNLFENAKNYHMSDVYDPPSPEFPIPSDPEDMEQIQYINYFDGRSKCIHQSPYPDEIRNAPEIFVCAFCLRSYHDKSEYINHANCCKWRHPPGNEIYRDPVEHISIFEVDGILEREYCRQLCLLSKVFLSSKTLYHEVDTFKFYILCEHTTKGFVIRGYFSKEKNPSKNNNLSCLLTLPNARRSGYGKFLIDLSYQISLREKKIGSPEHPLSDVGLLTYRSYWRAVAFAHIRQMRTRNESVFRIKDLSHSTGIHQSDLIQTLVESRIIHFPKESTSCFLNPNPVYYAPLSTIRRRVVKPELLVWRPEVPIAPGTKFTTYSAS